MLNHPIIVLGASAGGIEALVRIIQDLPANFPSAIFVVVHLPASRKSNLPQVLNRFSLLPVSHPQNKEAIQAGHIYVAPPNLHMLIEDGTICLSQDPKENGFRPAIDPLFRSAAQTYGALVIGGVLTGLLDDGTAGLSEIKERGGIAIVQDPETAMFPMMPESAIAHVDVDHILPVTDMAMLLNQLIQAPPVSPVPEKAAAFHNEAPKNEAPKNEALQNNVVPVPIHRIATKPPESMDDPPSGFICPECGGALWELQKKNLISLRCRVGHTYSQKSFLIEQSKELEAAMWKALRVLEERIAFFQRMASQSKMSNVTRITTRYEGEIQRLQQSADEIQRVLHDALARETLLDCSSEESL